MTVGGMKITPLQLGINHRLPPNNSGALPPLHELFKRRSYVRALSNNCTMAAVRNSEVATIVPLTIKNYVTTSSKSMTKQLLHIHMWNLAWEQIMNIWKYELMNYCTYWCEIWYENIMNIWKCELMSYCTYACEIWHENRWWTYENMK